MQVRVENCATYERPKNLRQQQIGNRTQLIASRGMPRDIDTHAAKLLNQPSFPKDLPATSLRLATGSEWSRVELAGALLKSLDREYRQLVDDADSKESILQRFAENSSWVLGKRVRIEENGSAFEGTTEGLDPRGFLQVRTPHGLQTVLSGTVRER